MQLTSLILFLAEDADIEEVDVESFLEFLYKGKRDSLTIPTCIPLVKYCLPKLLQVLF